MDLNAVLLAGVGIGAATWIGSLLGCGLDRVEGRSYGLITAAAAGIMLCAAVQGLVLPALEEAAALWVCAGIAAGAVLLYWMNGAVTKRIPSDPQRVHGLMFVFAIGIHHFPEGLAAGVSFGLGESADTAAVCIAIALQNIPEAMMIMPAMAAFGRKKAALAAMISGAVEIAGLAAGYAAVLLTVRLLPILLAMAAGAMLYVIFDNMLPDAYENGRGRTAAGVLTGYCGLLLLTELVERML